MLRDGEDVAVGCPDDEPAYAATAYLRSGNSLSPISSPLAGRSAQAVEEGTPLGPAEPEHRTGGVLAVADRHPVGKRRDSTHAPPLPPEWVLLRHVS